MFRKILTVTVLALIPGALIPGLAGLVLYRKRREP